MPQCPWPALQEGWLSYMSAGTAGAPVTWLMHLHLQALIPLSLEGTEVGQTKAAQALAKITITSNPEMAFPGERVSVMAVGWGMDLPKGQSGYCRGAASRRGCDGASLLLLQTGVCLPGEGIGLRRHSGVHNGLTA